MKIKFLLSFFMFFLISGCSFKNSYYKSRNDTLSIKQKLILQNTKKAQAINGSKLNSTIIASYLNAYDNSYKEFETFIVAIYKDKKIKADKLSFILNGKPSYRVVKIRCSDKMLKDFLVDNCWFDYYLVEFKKLNKCDRKILSINDKSAGNISLYFDSLCIK